MGILGHTELSDAPLKRLDMVFGPLPDSSLGFAIICALSLKLCS